MTDPQVAIFMLSIFIFLVLLGFPIAFTLIPIGVGFGYYAYFQADNLLNNQIFYLLNQNTYSVMESDILVAIPLFLFMGYVVERANIVNRLFFSLQLATRHLPGSMAVAALATCAIFATASGIIGAVVTLMGLLAFPGCVIAVSHDRWFLDRISTHILAFEGNSQVVWHEGNYSDYEVEHKKRLGDEALPTRVKYKKLGT